MEHLRKGGRPRRRQGGRGDYQEREAVLGKTREDPMTTESSADVAGLRGESVTLSTIGELSEQFLAAAGRGRRGGAPGVRGLTAGSTLTAGRRRPWRRWSLGMFLSRALADKNEQKKGRRLVAAR
jgi:hypothetical protein